MTDKAAPERLYPQALDTRNLKGIIGPWAGAIEYTMHEALANPERGSVDYDNKEDLVVYRLRPNAFDASLIDLFYNVDEIWVLQAGTRVFA